ncbi:hypothetical protein NX059_012223 [Plenodomus lindquistii]|nr:hypothetical protein NX059_012223 [Plenodomus lindquistii]
MPITIPCSGTINHAAVPNIDYVASSDLPRTQLSDSATEQQINKHLGIVESLKKVGLLGQLLPSLFVWTRANAVWLKQKSHATAVHARF